MVHNQKTPGRFRRFTYQVDDALIELARSHLFAWVVAVGSFVLASAVSLFPDGIRQKTRYFLSNIISGTRSELNWWVIVFWVALGILAFLVYYRFRGDNHRTRDIIAAIHKAPNRQLFYAYDVLFRTSEATANNTRTAANKAAATDEKVDILATGITSILERIVLLTSYFHTHQERARAVIGANVMLVASKPYPKEITDKLKFFDTGRQRLESLAAVLFLPKELTVTGAQDNGQPRNIPIISLPVPPAVSRNGNRLALPGAPHALLTGALSEYSDACRIADEDCKDFDAETRREVREYFSPGGLGEAIRSFVSLRIGTAREPVGVVNIDSPDDPVLGTHPEYHITFLALATPLLRLLEPLVADYAKLVFPPGVENTRTEEVVIGNKNLPRDTL